MEDLPWFDPPHRSQSLPPRPLVNSTTIRNRGFMAPWNHGSMTPWSHEAMVPCIHGSTAQRLHVSMGPWFHGPGPWPSDPWLDGTMVWLQGVMTPWLHGCMEPLSSSWRICSRRERTRPFHPWGGRQEVNMLPPRGHCSAMAPINAPVLVRRRLECVHVDRTACVDKMEDDNEKKIGRRG